MRKRYFAAELMWVFGRCARCGTTKELVARIPRWDGRWCRSCLAIRRRLEKEHVA